MELGSEPTVFFGGLSMSHQTMMSGSPLGARVHAGLWREGVALSVPHVLFPLFFQRPPILEGLIQAPPLCEASFAAQRSLVSQCPCTHVPPR